MKLNPDVWKIAAGAVVGAGIGAFVMRIVDKGSFGAAFPRVFGGGYLDTPGTVPSAVGNTSDTTKSSAPATRPTLQAVPNRSIPNISHPLPTLVSIPQSQPQQPPPQQPQQPQYTRTVSSPVMPCSQWQAMAYFDQYKAVQGFLYPGVPVDENSPSEEDAIRAKVAENTRFCEL